MAGSSIPFLGTLCTLGEALGGLWGRREAGKSEVVPVDTLRAQLDTYHNGGEE